MESWLNSRQTTRWQRRCLKAVMDKYKWRVGILTEMPPVGKVGVSPRCVLGFNVNRGQEISLRLRTDDLKGFRKIAVIRSTLIHELTHMVHDDHDNAFKALNSKLVKESQVLSSGQRVSWNGAGNSSAGEGFLGFEDHSESRGVDGHGAVGARTVGGALAPLADARAMAAAAALGRHQHRPAPPPSPSAPSTPVLAGSPLSNSVLSEGALRSEAGPAQGALGSEAAPAQSALPEVAQAGSGPGSGSGLGPDGGSPQEGQEGAREGDEPMSVDPAVLVKGEHASHSGAPPGARRAGHECESTCACAHAGTENQAGGETEQTDAMDVDHKSQAPPPPPEACDAPAASDANAATDNAQARGDGSSSGSSREGTAVGASGNEAGLSVGSGVGEGAGALGMEDVVPEELSGIASAVGEAQRRLAEAAQRLQQEALAGGAQKEGVAQAVATVRTILRNVMQHPGEHKFRTVKKTNRVFRTSVAHFPAAVELLRVAGFREKESEGHGGGLGDGGEGEVLHCKTPDPALLWLACSTLDQLSY